MDISVSFILYIFNLWNRKFLDYLNLFELKRQEKNKKIHERVFAIIRCVILKLF